MLNAKDAKRLSEKSSKEYEQRERLKRAAQAEENEKWAKENFTGFMKSTNEAVRKAVQSGRSSTEIPISLDSERLRLVADKVNAALWKRGFTVKRERVNRSDDFSEDVFIVSW